MHPLALYDDSPSILIPLLPFLAIVLALWVWQSSRGTRVLERWAKRRGVRLIEYRERWLARGPFFFTTARGQVVYRITVEYPDGRIATGWARCGSWFLGMLSDAVEVRWDADKPQPPGFSVGLPRDADRDPPG